MNPIEILVVDDNAAETFLVVYAVEDCPQPVKVHYATDGAEALRMLKTRKFDLVILDLNLPGLSGYEVLERCDPKSVPIVMFSVSSSPADAQRALALGAREFIQKPLKLELYRHTVLRMIETWVLNLQTTGTR